MKTIFLTLGFLLLASAGYASLRGAPWVPTWKKDLERIKRLAQLKEGDRFVELGCGTGRVCRYLAKHTPAQTYGVELSLTQYIYALLSSLVLPCLPLSSHPKFIFADAFHHDLSSYTVVYMFLMPETYKKIRDKLTQELPPGARVITYVWPIPGWTPSYVDRITGSPDLYVYVKK